MLSGVKRQRCFSAEGAEMRRVLSHVPWRDTASENKKDRNYSEICEKQTVEFEPKANGIHKRSHFHQQMEE